MDTDVMARPDTLERLAGFCYGAALFFAFPPERAEGRRAWSDVFWNTRGWDIPLWASSYRSEEQRLLDGSTLAVIESYERFGLQVNEELREIGDHISFEFAFAAFLAREAPNQEGGADAMRELRRFLAEELSFLMGHITEELSALPGRHAIDEEHRRVTKRVCAIERELREYADGIWRAGAGSAGEEPENCGTGAGPALPEDFPLPFFAPCAPGRGIGADETDIAAAQTPIRTAGRFNCGGSCAFAAWTKKGCVLRLDPDADMTPCVKHCVRHQGYLGTFLSHRRLRYPMKRVGVRGEGAFARISWDEAVSTIAREWRRVTASYGPLSRHMLYSSGVSAILRPDLLAARLAALDGGFLAHHYTYSAACIEAALPYVFGSVFAANSSKFLEKSKLIILWGHNPFESIFGAGLADALLRAKENGARIVSVDPRNTETAKRLGAEWHAVRPGTDAALADAMAYAILSERLEDRQFMDAHCIGFDEGHMPEGIPPGESYESYLFGRKDAVRKTPEWAEAITGLAAERIRALARAYACSKPAALLPGYGAQRHANGEQCVRAHAMLACLTGNVGIPGGSAGGGFVKDHPFPQIPVPEARSCASIPSFLWTDKVLDGSIKLLFNLAGNTLINQHSDINRTKEILSDPKKCEFIVVSDTFMTPSARFADILLPAPSFLETENIPYTNREGDYLLYNNVVAKPLFESRFEYDWLKDLAGQLGLRGAFTQGNESAQDWLRFAYRHLAENVAELPPFDEFARNGGYAYAAQTEYIAFRDQAGTPEADRDAAPFATPSGKVEIFSERLFALGDEGIPGLPGYVPGFEGPADPRAAEYPLQMVGWHTKRRCHSIHDNNPWMDKIEKPFVHMNKSDAEARGIREGDLAIVWNDRGKMKIPAHVSGDIMRGVCAVAQGAWHTPDEDGTDVRGSVNILTTSRPTPLANGNPQHSNLVEIRRAT